MFLGLTLPLASTPGFFNVADQGAKRDGRVKDTQAIQKTIAACAAAGGGTVYFPAGRYLSGGLRLESNLTLWLDAGAELIYSGDPADSPPVPTRWEGTRAHTHAPLLHADGCENISVVGRGTINGDGRNWWEPVREARDAWLALQRRIEAGEMPGIAEFAPAGRHLRPSLVLFRNCKNLLVEGVTLAESPMWMLHPLCCENLSVKGVTFLSTGPNGDGIAVDSCCDVRISDCFFSTGDDCIALKSGRDADGRRGARPTERVVINQCIMHRGHGAVSIGSETAGGIRDVIASNIVARGVERGIRLKSTRGRGGLVENIRFDSWVIEDALEQAVEITSRYSDMPAEPFSARTPVFRNIGFSHLTIANARRVVSIAGLAEQAVEQVRFMDVVASGRTGFRCECAADVLLHDVRVDAAEGNAWDFIAVRDLKLAGLQSPPIPGRDAQA